MNFNMFNTSQTTTRCQTFSYTVIRLQPQPHFQTKIRNIFRNSKKQRGNTGAILRPKVGEIGTETRDKANIIELARFQARR